MVFLWSETLPIPYRRFLPVLDGKRFMFYAVCVVTLMGRLCKVFLPERALKFCEATSKEIHPAQEILSLESSKKGKHNNFGILQQAFKQIK